MLWNGVNSNRAVFCLSYGERSVTLRFPSNQLCSTRIHTNDSGAEVPLTPGCGRGEKMGRAEQIFFQE